ncbi:NAC domain-containing protein 83-like [Lotus japonicus]|uniref:NAC domain-containing protein 83-like n=1 Tax=Lotus japonicus TaxID=34305 RepID=UPI002588FC6C|nr:NAC domain-containing protein 83-like [Lotus japonicus]
MEGLITCDKDGGIRLLPGYMFDPTDEVLVNFYLKRRAFAQPLPVQIIPNFDVFQTEPWKLPGGDGKIFNQRKCFFYNTMGRDLESLDLRVVGSGQWKVVEKGRDIPIPPKNEVIGKRNTLVFWELQGACARRTKWVMHEFRLLFIANPSKISNWVVYRIFLKQDANMVKMVKNTRGSNGNTSNGGENFGSVEVIELSEESGNILDHPSMPPS